MELQPKTRVGYDSILELHLLPRFGPNVAPLRPAAESWMKAAG